MLFNITTGQWDDELCDLLHIPQSILPQVRSSSEIYGTTEVLGGRTPVAGIAGDQQAALFGQACFTRGLAKNTYGTGCFMLMNVGDQPVASKHQLLTTVAWQLRSPLPGGERVRVRGETQTDSTRTYAGEVRTSPPSPQPSPLRGEGVNTMTYALEGSVFIGGAVVQWLRDGLGIIKSAADIERLAMSVPDSGGVYLVPAFAGLGAPHWDQYARGTIAGITRGTTAAHFARAALEGIAFQVADVIDVMSSDSGIPIKELRVDGGAAANNLLMQFQADLLGVPVVRPKVLETTALGAAYLAGLAVGFWKNADEVKSHWSIDRTFEPNRPRDEIAHRRKRWAMALERSREWDKQK
jgi:glycerol kinase